MQALALIEEQNQVVAAARQKAAELKAGMDLFNIPQPPYKELASMASDLEKLAEVWAVVSQWEASYASWKQSKFKDVQVRQILIMLWKQCCHSLHLVLCYLSVSMHACMHA